MNPYLLLDVLLLILLALFVPIGFWRGAQREVLVTLGVLLGVVLGEFWAGPWGQDLATRSGLSENGGVFLVAMLFLVGSTFLVGYGLGAALIMPAPGLAGRLAGALVAAGNGALLLGFSLRDIRIFLLQNDVGLFDRAIVARLLSESLGWLLLGGAIAFLPVIVYLALFGQGPVAVEYEPMDEEFERQQTPTRRYPPRAPASAGRPPVAYKTEPPRPAAEETRPIRVVEERQTHPPKSSTDISSMDTAVLARRPERHPAGQSAEPLAGRCPHCHAQVRQDDVFCPRCGRIL
ncbi:zinc ribbon domain-containing protein [Thermomicrobiaceae bacterium CFH 74404]|uniref:Zinc ribbon domain-containing protein n=1 Tax=Thermalbibacter longus TaxID=2951981 RepID=A0AA41WHF2_9BACT|nr:zinc ribbon domain-containing protein [Thermalbibacter longus]MCM8750095.1 zinc ribbon domain-containing protein [Thermalbibacter longus]